MVLDHFAYESGRMAGRSPIVISMELARERSRAGRMPVICQKVDIEAFDFAFTYSESHTRDFSSCLVEMTMPGVRALLPAAFRLQAKNKAVGPILPASAFTCVALISLPEKIPFYRFYR